jgi:hypothetical protein
MTGGTNRGLPVCLASIDWITFHLNINLRRAIMANFNSATTVGTITDTELNANSGFYCHSIRGQRPFDVHPCLERDLKQRGNRYGVPQRGTPSPYARKAFQDNPDEACCDQVAATGKCQW